MKTKSYFSKSHTLAETYKTTDANTRLKTQGWDQ